MTGLARVLAEESPTWICTLVHLEPEASAERDGAVLLGCAMAQDRETEVAYRHGVRHVARLERRAKAARPQA